MRAEAVRAEVRGRRVLHVVEGCQEVAPGRFERVRVVLREQACKERKLWN